jgi:hypothetical protein
MRSVPWLLVLALAACSSPEPIEGDLADPQAIYIAPDDLVDAVQEIADWRCRTGVTSEVVALSDALDGGSGPDDAARLRDYLTERWQGGNLKYVILAGDAGELPTRYVHATVNIEAEQVYEEADVLSDLYFADLDGDWDPDGDEAYGELDDPADLLPDVAIGRLPVENAFEVQAYADKILSYERYPRDDYQDKLMLSAGYAGMGIYASQGLELLVVPELPEHLQLTRLYEDWEEHDGAEDLTADSWSEAFADGHAVVYHMGHGNEQTVGPLLTVDDVAAIDNAERPSVLVTCECLGGRFDYEESDSSGETFVKGGTGGVIYMGSTHLGIGFPSFSIIMQDLAVSMYERLDAPTTMGDAVRQVMREYSTEEALHSEANVDRWTSLVSVVLGDPTLQLYTDIPERTYIDGEADDGGVTLTVTDRNDEPLTDVLVTAYLSGEYLLMQRTDSRGQVSFEGSAEAFADTLFTATGRNRVPQEWTVDDAS